MRQSKIVHYGFFAKRTQFFACIYKGLVFAAVLGGSKSRRLQTAGCIGHLTNQDLGNWQNEPNSIVKMAALRWMIGQPVTLSRTPSKIAARSPEFGEQAEEVL